jgi:7,8-dihydro-6-hydroxymethylpterin-pyrophosphokinase
MDRTSCPNRQSESHAEQSSEHPNRKPTESSVIETRAFILHSQGRYLNAALNEFRTSAQSRANETAKETSDVSSRQEKDRWGARWEKVKAQKKATT